MYIRQVPLPASCAYFFVKCGQSHPEGSARTEEGGFVRRSRERKKHTGVRIFAGRALVIFLIPWTVGSNIFWGRASFATGREPNLLFWAVGKRPKVIRLWHILSINYFRGFYTKGVHIFWKGVNTKGVHILLLFLLSPFQERMDRFSTKNGDAK